MCSPVTAHSALPAVPHSIPFSQEGGVSPCSCNTQLHHHHLSLFMDKAEQQQSTFREQIPLEINKPNSLEVWDPPLGSGEHIQNKAQVCKLPMLLILSNVKQFQSVSQQH